MRYVQSGNAAGAKIVLEEIVKIKPRHVDALHGLGVVSAMQADYREAETRFREVLKYQPDYVEAHVNLGRVLENTGRFEEALAVYQRAIALRPNIPSAHFRRGMALQALGRPAEAITSYDRAVALKPDFREAYANRGAALAGLQRYEDALLDHQKALALDSQSAETYHNRGAAFLKLHRLDEALADFDHALALQPNFAAAHNSRGAALTQLGRCNEAIQEHDAALALNPGLLEAYNNRANALVKLGRHDDAYSDYEHALRIKPEHPFANMNQALISLLKGDFEEGWQKYEWRWKVAETARPLHGLDLSLWSSKADIRDKDLLLVAEQGVGDEIMFAGLIGDVMQDARSITLECEHRLVGLFQRSFPAVNVIKKRDPPLELQPLKRDKTIATGSLARLYRGHRQDFPEHRGYLKADAEIIASWKRRLTRLGDRPKIGISWRGGTALTNLERRSISIEQLAPILDVDGISLVSVQYGKVEQEIARHNASCKNQISHFADSQTDFDQLAGLIECLDLVISVQTAVVHLCGALGKACWCMVPVVPEWRYGLTGDRMPWYPSVRLFRQASPNDWSNVIGEIRQILCAQAQRVD